MSKVLHIVPKLPPLVDGLGDYALLLGRGLAVRGIESHFLVSDRKWNPKSDEVSARCLGEVSASGIDQALAGEQLVLLHFVNYAYEPIRGCPWHLLEGLTRWRRGHSGRRLVVMFHELYAMGWPWRKAFWYSAPQRAITAALARLADYSWTSNARYAKWLTAVIAREVPVIPVLSNIGEPERLQTFETREPAIVVFGRAVNRMRAYRILGDDIITLGRRYGLTQIHDVGEPLSQSLHFPGLPVISHGLLQPMELSNLLQRCRVGIIHNQKSPLAKSGVVAAYAAHGVLIACDTDPCGEDGLVRGHNLLVLGEHLPPAMDTIAANGRHWYLQHDLSHVVDRIATWFTEPTVSTDRP